MIPRGVKRGLLNGVGVVVRLDFVVWNMIVFNKLLILWDTVNI